MQLCKPHLGSISRDSKTRTTITAHLQLLSEILDEPMSLSNSLPLIFPFGQNLILVFLCTSQTRSVYIYIYIYMQIPLDVYYVPTLDPRRQQAGVTSRTGSYFQILCTLGDPIHYPIRSWRERNARIFKKSNIKLDQNIVQDVTSIVYHRCMFLGLDVPNNIKSRFIWDYHSSTTN